MAQRRIGIIGGGPAGLMAAEAAVGPDTSIHIFEAMPTLGRKLLMAGKSGLNITHSEAPERFAQRFGDAGPRLAAALGAFDGQAVRDWCSGLGIETFVGSSGRVFPLEMKASPLLRAWLARLADKGVHFHTRHRWTGFSDDKLAFETPKGPRELAFDAVVLALGGASWPRLGSDAAWLPRLAEKGIVINDFRPANCGFEVDWSADFVARNVGQPVKPVVATSALGSIPGEFVISRWGVEGSLVYTHSSALRDAIERNGSAVLSLDLAPGRSAERLAADIARQPAKASFANRMRKAAGLGGVKLGLLREAEPSVATLSPDRLAALIKALPLRLVRTRPIAEAISSAGGVDWSSVDTNFMLRELPGVFAAGEMLDWEAPTGGYLLTACMATGRAAGEAARRYIE